MLLGVTIDDEALEAFYINLYEKYGPMLRRRCERVLNNQADAEDLVQGLFVDLIQRKRRDIDFSYLYRAATNRCITFVNSTKRRRDLLERELNPDFEYRYQLDDKVVDLQLLSLLVKRLDKKSSEILVYRFLDNMKQTEIASMMGVTRRTVRNYLKRIEKAAKGVQGARNGRVKFWCKGENR